MRGIDRRTLLQSVLLLAGAGASTSASARALFAAPGSLSRESLDLLGAVADTIVPRTDTPGAVDAGVPAMFDKLITNWASAAQRAQLLAALKAIDASAGGFVALSPAMRFEMLDRYDRANTGGGDYSKLKDLLVSLYYLSEAGATIELRYEHSPGAWEPSLPVTAETRNAGGAAGF